MQTHYTTVYTSLAHAHRGIRINYDTQVYIYCMQPANSPVSTIGAHEDICSVLLPGNDIVLIAM